jgi:hypothetical protein
MCCRTIFIFALIILLSLTTVSVAEMVAYWPLDEDIGGITLDKSGNGLDGMLVGQPGFTAGMYGPAIRLDESNTQYVDCGIDPAFDITEQLTVAAWIKMNHVTDRQPIVNKEGDGVRGIGYRVESGGIVHVQLYKTGGAVKTDLNSTVNLEADRWYHLAFTYEFVGDGSSITRLYIDGEEHVSTEVTVGPLETNAQIQEIGRYVWSGSYQKFFNGLIDDVVIFNHVLSAGEIRDIMNGLGGGFPLASSPDPRDGTIHEDTWVTLSWRPGDFAVSHDVYLGDNLSDVNEATRDSDVFRINQDLTFYIAGIPGYAYPVGLVPGTTYYWRIDEVNDTEPNSPWKGDVWSYTIPPKTAYSPVPADGAVFVLTDTKLTWTPGFGAKTHTVYLGEDFDTVNDATGGVSIGVTSYTPDSLKLAKTYYWRIDEFDGAGTYKGDVWSFTTEGAVSGPNPASGAVDVNPSLVLTWDAGAVAASHEVYFGTDADAVANATKVSPEYKGPKALGEESYDPGRLALQTEYFWRIDEVNSVNPNSPWKGNIWSFTTGDFFVIDNFEDYNADTNQIWWAWKDGLGYVAHDNEPAYAGNGTGSAVGDETTASYTEETIVHGGSQSMPFFYDNDKQDYANYSEAELTLTALRDWTSEGVAELSLWYRGRAASGSLTFEAAAGTYTMTGAGSNIWGSADEFHFAPKELTGDGSIALRVDNIVPSTHGDPRLGVMIRDTLDADARNATLFVEPDPRTRLTHRFQPGGDTATAVATAEGETPLPTWIRLTREGFTFKAERSTDGVAWRALTDDNPAASSVNIAMTDPVYIGLVVCSHVAGQFAEATYSNVQIVGNVNPTGPFTTSQDIGIESNAAEPLYVAVSNTAGQPALVVHEDPAAATIDTWTEWVIPLSTFADQGINPTNVDRIAIGLGTWGNMTVPGGSGKMYFDDIRLYQPREAAE